MFTRLLVFICLGTASGIKVPVNGSLNTDILTRERVRRLIPYMAYYVQPYRHAPVQNHQYYQPQPQQQQYLLPVPQQYRHGQGPRYIVQQPSPLKKLITQNYLALSKQINAPKQSSVNQYYVPQYKPVQYKPESYREEQKEPAYSQLHDYPVSYAQQEVKEVEYNDYKSKQPEKVLYKIPSQYYNPQYESQFKNYYQQEQDIKQQEVSITQSQEIPVQNLPETRYHASYVANPSYDENTSEDVDKNLNDILDGFSISKSLPDKITPQNLDSSIKTLSKLLKILQSATALPNSAKDIVQAFPKPEIIQPKPLKKLVPKLKPSDDSGSTPGQAGVDYPAYHEIPHTSFSCKTQRYKGFFGDPDTGCQVWHYCDLNGGQASFLCPNGTIFSQVALTCDWWFNVKCATTTQLYVLNERLYKYILPQKPKFPEDYSGPLVDHYLTLKFQEIDEKNKNKTEVSTEDTSEEDLPFSFDIDHKNNKVRSIKS